MTSSPAATTTHVAARKWNGQAASDCKETCTDGNKGLRPAGRAGSAPSLQEDDQCEDRRDDQMGCELRGARHSPHPQSQDRCPGGEQHARAGHESRQAWEPRNPTRRVNRAQGRNYQKRQQGRIQCDEAQGLHPQVIPRPRRDHDIERGCEHEGGGQGKDSAAHLRILTRRRIARSAKGSSFRTPARD